MDAFTFWQRWGFELDDSEFASAMIVLGIFASSSERITSNYSNNEIKEFLEAITKKKRSDNELISWKFPKFNERIKFKSKTLKLSDLKPKRCANAWKNVIQNSFNGPRIQILRYPLDLQISSWFNLFFKADPPVASAHIVIKRPLKLQDVKWPLRLGYLPGNEAETIITNACKQWPSNNLTRNIKIGRQDANCDVLIFSGSSDQLLIKLLEIPVPLKTNLFIVRGLFEENPSTINERLSAIVSEGYASGIIFINGTTEDNKISEAVNHFVEGVSHNESFDFAISRAFSSDYQMEPVIFLSEKLARLQLKDLTIGIEEKLMNLPDEARLQMDEEILHQMNIPASTTDTKDWRIPKKAAKKFKKVKSNIKFDQESRGAKGMSRMDTAIDAAENLVSDKLEHQRFLQEQVLVKKDGNFIEEKRGFVKDVPTLIRVRIGPPDKKWTSVDVEFPYKKLPQKQDVWNLKIVLTEPNHLKESLINFVNLPKKGSSSECEFRIVLRKLQIFEGRITVVHRGRVLQTGLLKAKVVKEDQKLSPKNKITFSDLILVRSHIGDLSGRRQFDLSFVLNHNDDDRPQLQAIAEDHAWCHDLSNSKKITSDINNALSKIAKSVLDYQGKITSENNRELLIELANLGNGLYWSIVEDQINRPGNRRYITNKEYIQIVSTKPESIVPFEFIYEFEAPDDDASPCPSWDEALNEGTCEQNCAMDKIKNVCPLGFWGITKVIERHDITTEFAAAGKDFYLQSEPSGDRERLLLKGSSIFGASKKVENKDIDSVISSCNKHIGSPPKLAKSWKDWETIVQRYEPNLLVALTHTDGDGIKATIEIRDDTIQSNRIRETHVRKKGSKTWPLVALIGCDTIGTALEYGSHVRWFRRRGAGIVIGTIATVFGEHASKVAELIIIGLKSNEKKVETLGEVIREIKKQSLLNGQLMPLCIVAYGDADWKIN